MPTRYDIFLSYSRANTARVEPLRDELRRLGYTVFFDTESLAPAQPWKPRLKQAIQNSRVMVLCWSETASHSEVTAFEYTSAEALNKPVIPWLLDTTDLPIMLRENQGSRHPDPVEFARYIRPTLGRPIAARSRLKAIAAAGVAAVLAVGIWLALRPPPPAPPWEFQGEVIDRITLAPIPGVTVQAAESTGTAPHGPKSTLTGPDGHYSLTFPAPQPATIHLVFHADGYIGDQATVPANKPFKTDLAKLP